MKTSIKTWVAVHAKTCWTFLVIFATQVIYRLQDPTQGPLPAMDDPWGWVTLLGICFTLSLPVYAQRNKQTPEQVAHGFKKLSEQEQQAVVQAVGPGPHA